MITVKFYFENESISGFETKGHAFYDKKGQDIVCAAVSALTQSAILGLGEFVKRDSFSFSVEDGLLKCFLKENLQNKEYQDSQVIMITLYLGLRAIEDEYRTYVKIFREV